MLIRANNKIKKEHGAKGTKIIIKAARKEEIVMGKVMIVYATSSGNTKIMANYIAEGIKEEGYEVVIIDALAANPKELVNYDGFLLGSYSWDGLPDEILDIYDELPFLDLSGKKTAAFGSGDPMYDVFCIAVDQIIEQLNECGAEVVMEGLKVELTPGGSDIDKCIEFGRKFAWKLKDK